MTPAASGHYSFRMELNVRERGGVTLLDLDGKLTRIDGAELLAATVDRLVAAGRANLVLNLAGVPYMDSSGIGELLATRKKTLDVGGAAKLLNPLKRVYDTLQLVKLADVFEMFQDEAAAVASFD